MYHKTQYISQGKTAQEQLYNIQRMLDSGIQWIQLRFKNEPEIAVFRLAEIVKKAIESYDCTYIINDYLPVAKAVCADGVHLGLTDEKVEIARIALGENAIIGGTANTFADILQRYHENCNYVGLGPYSYTLTKEKLSPILGLEGYKAIINQMKLHHINIPIYAIGGIQLQDVTPLMENGIYGIATSGLLTQANNPNHIISQLNNIHYATT